MSRSAVISTIPIFAMLIVGTVSSAFREEIITHEPIIGELHETRESEVNRKEESLHRLGSVLKEPLSVANQSRPEEPTVLSPTTIEHEKVQFNDSESKDMLETHVTPQDDDDMTSEKPLDKARRGSILKTTNPKYHGYTTILPPMVFPKNSTDVDIRMATPEWIHYMNQNIDRTNGTDPVTVNITGKKPLTISIVTLPSSSSSPTEASPSTATPTTTVSEEVTTTDRTTKTATTTTTTTRITTERVTLVPEFSHENREELTTTTNRPTSSSESPAEKKLHEKRVPLPKPMPFGVAALIAAISFAIIVIVTYVGLLLRRRYLEWRHGNRELLVNDFDAADMSNFEL